MRAFGCKNSGIRAQKCELAAVSGAQSGGILVINNIREPGIRDDMRDRSTILTVASAFLCACLVACNSEPPPRSVTELMENPILLEAAVVRCAQNRAKSRSDVECMNAREAVMIIAAREEASRRAELEAQSERKRQALRRTQQAAAEARRRAEEERRRQEEAAYLAQFGEVLLEPSETETLESNAPVAILPEPPPPGAAEPIESPYDDTPYVSPPTAPDTGNAPVVEVRPEAEPESTELESIREELKRRSEQDGS